MSRDMRAVENFIEILEKVEDSIFDMQVFLTGLSPLDDAFYNFANEDIEKIDEVDRIIGKRLGFFKKYLEEYK